MYRYIWQICHGYASNSSWWFALNLEGNVVVPAKVFGMMSMFFVRREVARCVGTRGTTDPAKNHKMMRV